MSTVEQAADEIGVTVERIIEDAKHQMAARGFRAANELTNAVLHVLAGGRSGKEPLVLGVGISFDIVAFPKQQMVIPSPVAGVNQFIKEKQSSCIIIGKDEIPSLFKAQDNKPIVYVRQTSIRNIRTSYAMAWMEADINIHVIAPTLFERNAWVAAIVMDLSLERECLMENKSPYLIQNILQRSDANHIQTGQISIKGQYGVMRKIKPEQKLNNVYMDRS